MSFGKTLFIYNPVSGPGKKRIPAEIISANLEYCQIEFDLLRSLYRGHIKEYLNENHNIYKTIVCSGGDGTVNEIINSQAINSNPSILLIPQGTGNDLYRSLKLHYTQNVSNILDFSRYKRRLQADMGQIKGIYEDGSLFEKRFCNSIGCGIDSLIAKFVSEIVHRTNFSYVKSLLKSLIFYKNIYLEAETGSQAIKKEILLISVNNGKCSGGGFYLAPDAHITDNELDMCVIEKTARIKALINFSKVLSNRLKEFEEASFFKGNFFRIKITPAYYLHIDGELEKKKVKEFTISLCQKKQSILIQ